MRNTAETSIVAYLTHLGEGKARNQRELVLNFLRGLPTVGLSRKELSVALGMPLQSICARVHELKQDGLVVEDPARRCAYTDRWVKPVRIAPDLLSTVATERA